MDRAPRGLETIDVRSGRRETLIETAEGETAPRPAGWSADGASLLCVIASRNGGGPQAGLFDLEKRELQRLRPLPRRCRTPRLSPDGRYLVCSAGDAFKKDLFLAGLDDESEEIRLTRSAEDDIQPFWSPDGGSVFFIRMDWSWEGGILWRVPIEPETGRPGGSARHVATLGHHSRLLAPSISESGEFFMARREGGDFSQAYLLEVHPETGEPVGEPTSDFPLRTAAGHWTRDGKMLYTNWAIQGTQDQPIRVERDIATGKERIVPVEMPSWMPEGGFDYVRETSDKRYVYFAAAGDTVVYRHDRRTGKIDPVYETNEPLSGCGLTPEETGLTVSTRSRARGLYSLRLVRLSDKRETTLATSRSNPQAVWSPDRRELAYPDGNCLMVVSRSGGPPTELACAPPMAMPEPGKFVGTVSRALWWNALNANWSPDGTKLAWTVPVRDKRRVELWIINRQTGERIIGWAGGVGYSSFPRSPHWSPDGKYINFTMGRYTDTEIWAVEFPD
jgi:dipeptidyl aminopeptidase/acylaminoacyl peptidase